MEHRQCKTTWVADSLHGTIPLSSIEKAFISTQIFNRLHNVLQNSTVYFTYPSNRTSRFIHSLGCAHIAGNIFRSAIVNASRDDRRGFFKLAGEAIEEIDEQHLQPKLHQIVSAAYLKQGRMRGRGNPNLAEWAIELLPAGLTPKTQHIFLLLYQAVRLVGLLHDIGHPPFSHVCEFALQHIYESLRATSKHDNELVTWKKWLEGGRPFHEELGRTLSQYLFDHFYRNREGDSKFDDAARLQHELLKEVVTAILDNRTSLFRSLHSIVDGDLDADRLDYVPRDLISSGLSRDSLRLDRLINSFTLVRDGEATALDFLFAPSVRALHNIEEFYRQRFNLYKYVVNHHRVVKFDGLLQRVVISLAKDRIGATAVGKKARTTPGDNSHLAGLELASDISGLWQVFGARSLSSPKYAQSAYVQWDDAWLLSILRSEWLRRDAAGSHSNTHADFNRVTVQLEELLSNQKKYFSLCKRAESFVAIDAAFSSKAREFKISAEMLRKKLDKRIAPTELARLSVYLADGVVAGPLKSKSDHGTLVASHGFALSILLRVLGNSKMSKEQSWLELSGQRCRRAIRAEDVILISKPLKIGLSSDFRIVDTRGKVIPIGTVSRIYDELNSAVLAFPPLFAFVYSKKVDESDFETWRIELGEALAFEFDNWLKRQ